MMQLLMIDEAGFISIKSARLPKGTMTDLINTNQQLILWFSHHTHNDIGTYVKVQPQSVSFLDITNPKAV